MTTMAQLDALSTEFDGWNEDRISTAQARHDVPAGYCPPCCESAYDSPSGGWYELYPDDPDYPDTLEPGDIYVEAWGKGWYRRCKDCNGGDAFEPRFPAEFIDLDTLGLGIPEKALS